MSRSGQPLLCVWCPCLPSIHFYTELILSTRLSYQLAFCTCTIQGEFIRYGEYEKIGNVLLLVLMWFSDGVSRICNGTIHYSRICHQSFCVDNGTFCRVSGLRIQTSFQQKSNHPPSKEQIMFFSFNQDFLFRILVDWSLVMEVWLIDVTACFWWLPSSMSIWPASLSNNFALLARPQNCNFIGLFQWNFIGNPEKMPYK